MVVFLFFVIVDKVVYVKVVFILCFIFDGLKDFNFCEGKVTLFFFLVVLFFRDVFFFLILLLGLRLLFFGK